MHADHLAGWSDVLRPAEGGRSLYRYSCFHRRRQNLFFVLVALRFEDAPRRHADYARLDSFRFELLVGGYAQRNFASRRDENDFRFSVGCVGQNICSFCYARG